MLGRHDEGSRAMASPRLERMAAKTQSEAQARAAIMARNTNVMRPISEKLRLVDLPDPRSEKWGLRMKAQVIFAVEGGLSTQA